MRPIITALGYFFLLVGFISIILNMIGLGLVPISYIDKNASPLVAFIFKVALILVGFIMFYMGRTMRAEELEND
jgi:hypothetical protein